MPRDHAALTGHSDEVNFPSRAQHRLGNVTRRPRQHPSAASQDSAATLYAERAEELSGFRAMGQPVLVGVVAASDQQMPSTIPTCQHMHLMPEPARTAAHEQGRGNIAVNVDSQGSDAPLTAQTDRISAYALVDEATLSSKTSYATGQRRSGECGGADI